MTDEARAVLAVLDAFGAGVVVERVTASVRDEVVAEAQRRSDV